MISSKFLNFILISLLIGSFKSVKKFFQKLHLTFSEHFFEKIILLNSKSLT